MISFHEYTGGSGPLLIREDHIVLISRCTSGTYIHLTNDRDVWVKESYEFVRDRLFRLMLEANP